MTTYTFPSEFKEETAACLPPPQPENLCPSRHVHPSPIFELKHRELTAPPLPRWPLTPCLPPL